MIIKTKHRIKVKNGKISFTNVDAFKAELAKYEDQEAYIILGKDRNTRSNRQNRYYHGVILEVLSDELGYNKDEIHEVLKEKFLDKKTLVLNNEEFSIKGSTRKLNTKEFEQYASQVRMWASSELNIFIPLPNEAEY